MHDFASLLNSQTTAELLLGAAVTAPAAGPRLPRPAGQGLPVVCESVAATKGVR